ncbi:MAG TPA: LuxR C-terminal-related transcriptional regulator, partial [Acidimicrobiales bacterium]|nr:LuxR C-terminal-related transcriptional regulator [Acidimicrobiales bacterium]
LERDAAFLRRPGAVGPPRHLTLQATLDWSYQLLSPDERRLLRRLSAFQGTWGLDAAEAVAADAGSAGSAGDGDRPADDVVDVLSGLVDKSLVQVVSRAGARRYRMLETVRVYAARALLDNGETAAAHRAHRQWFTAMAAQAVAGLDGPDQLGCLDRLDLEHDNLRAALRRGLAADPEAGAQLAGLLWPFWYRRGHYGEARDWLEQAVALETSPATRAAVLTGAGTLAFLQCDYPKATVHLQAARELYQRLGDRRGDAVVVQRLGSVARERGDYPAARAYHEAALGAFEDLGNEAGVAASRDYLGFVAWLEGDLPAAETLCRQAATSFRAGRHQQEYAAALINLGGILVSAGRPDEARLALEEGLTISRGLGYREGIAWACHQEGVLALVEQRPADALGPLVESLEIHHALGDRWRVASVLENLAGALADLAVDDAALATPRRLLASAAWLRRQLQVPVPPVEAPLVRRAEAAVADGQWREALGVDQAVALAVAAATTEGQVAETVPATPADFPQSPLTSREVEVLRLLSDGLTNRQIAEALYISSSTAGVHVSNILRKLGATSRAQAVTVGYRLGLLAPL